MITNQQILENAIQKAIDGGWDQDYRVKFSFTNSDGSRRFTARTSVDDWDTYAPIIFNHDFAKALWGEERGENVKVNKDGSISPIKASKPFGMYVIPAWQHHLQQMVIADDPIKYLGENI